MARFPENLPPYWRELLAPEAEKEYFKNLTRFLKREYESKKVIFPPQDKILRAIQEIDYPDIKVVILGQDPYHGPNQAMGLCFAVPNSLAPKPPSLMNIFKEIETDLHKKVDFKASELKEWVKEGVLLLNTVLTVRRGQAFSHTQQGWEQFTDRVIELLNERKEAIVFILWGAPARKKKLLITGKQHRIIESAHPSPLSAHKGFFGTRPFSKTNAALKEIGREPIPWEVTG